MKGRTANASRAERTPRSIVIDARMLGRPQCFGIARVIIEMVSHFPRSTSNPVKMLVPTEIPPRFDLTQLPSATDVIPCEAPVGQPHRVAALARTLRVLNAGVLYSPYHALAPLWAPCPTVVSVHDCIFEADMRLANGRIRQLAYMANTARVLRQAVAVAVPSAATAETIPAFYGHVPAITVCRNGVNGAAFVPLSARQLDAASKRLSLPERFVLNVGSRRAHKNQAILVRALARMDPTISLVLIGRRDPRSDDQIDQLVAELRLQDRVLALDGISDADLAAVYQLASVFAFPSLAEGFGLPPLEAMAAGSPVVASSIPAVAEVCGDAALLISPHDPAAWSDALSMVVTTPSLRTNMVQRGFKAASAAGWQDGATELFTLLTRIAQRSPGWSLPVQQVHPAGHRHRPATGALSPNQPPPT